MQMARVRIKVFIRSNGDGYFTCYEFHSYCIPVPIDQAVLQSLCPPVRAIGSAILASQIWCIILVPWGGQKSNV